MNKWQAADDATDQLWNDWFESKSLDARNKLVENYLPWVRTIARTYCFRYRGGGFELTDFVQVGVEALIKSIERYDRSKNNFFKPYAYKRIKGSIIDWSINCVSPSISREVGVEDIIASLEEPIDTEEGLLDYAVEAVLGVSLPIMLHEHYTYVSKPLTNPLSLCMDYYVEVRLNRLVLELNELERAVIEGHYRLNKTISLIAKELGFSQGRVSQIHIAALKKIRQKY